MNSKYRRTEIICIMMLINIIFSFALFSICGIMLYPEPYEIILGNCNNTMLVFLYAVLIIMINRKHSSFEIERLKASGLTYLLSSANAVIVGFFYAIIAISWFCLPNSLITVTFILMQILWNWAWIQIENKIYKQLKPTQKTATLYRCKIDLRRLEEILNNARKRGACLHVEKVVALENIKLMCAMSKKMLLKDSAYRHVLLRTVFLGIQTLTLSIKITANSPCLT